MLGDLFTGITDFIGLTDSEAGDRAAAYQQQAADQANARLEKNYNESKDRYSNYLESGDDAYISLSDLARNMKNFQDAEGRFQGHDGVFTRDDFEKDEGYQFRRDEGLKALNRGLASQGMIGSGAAMKALARYGQNFASNEYQNARNNFNQDYANSYQRYNNDYDRRFNSLNSIANYGLNAKNAITNAGSATTAGINQNIIGMGNANASKEMNRESGSRLLYDGGMQVLGAYLGSK